MGEANQKLTDSDLFVCQRCDFDSRTLKESVGGYIINHRIDLAFDNNESKTEWLCIQCACKHYDPDYKNRVYLAGKVTGLNRIHCSQKFGMEEVKLLRKGLEVINPLNLVPSRTTWEDAMYTCVQNLMKCSTAYFLPCWKDSKGATLEHELAKQIGINIVYL